MPEIILKNITKKFGKALAVDNLNLVIRDREFVTLLGPSGCGKTTTLRMIAGLETPTEGEIFIDGSCVFSSETGIDISPDKRNVGFLFQNYALWPHMTVYKNVAFGLENMKWDKGRIENRVRELLEMLRIEEFSGRYPSELSGGQQQRVAIARTLATGPKILFMDEPLSNLDAKLRMEMRTELKRLHVETDSTFVYVTHDQLEAMTLSTKICLLKDGLLQQFDSPLEVYHNPSNYIVGYFVGSPNINVLEVSGNNINLDEIKLSHRELEFLFVPTSSSISIEEGQTLLLGIRPEDISITDDGEVEAAIYSTLPSGMETIVKLDMNGLILTCVVFGSVDFAMGEKVRISFHAAHNVLFDKKSERNLAVGKLM
ncbi:ABC transporter ATP-binding protein [Oceanispirochaeta sp.]|jgi:multiple sugar transport system ATP-binding protein|uniref:ABC transporter ATP-binding protein n=1 Tax=Oceanispirochaeta sp. TaxID=2035350 RepID=UPI00260EF4F5|nr:ABC transporter ATP-binding protein [Oceanispirochaeta sp.]MDA3956343.1 ABC transporter ATP-binding protein [Oceanispirochaeta sp.]